MTQIAIFHLINMSQVDIVARKLSGQSVRMVCEVLGSSPGRACVFSSPVTGGDSVWVRAQAANCKATLVSSGMVLSRFRDESN